jgi:DNA-directed RNA polymerase specialized sigma24 family protein
MSDWKQFENESTPDLVQIIKWKDQADYTEDAENAFIAFCFRFRVDLSKKCEVICSNHGYDIDIAKELVNRVFHKFWNNPGYDDSKRKHAKSGDEGIRFYLYGIARYELVNIYRDKIDPNPYTGEEEIVWDFPEIDEENISVEKRRELQERKEIMEMALSRLSPKHKAIYLTYLVYEKKGKNLPRHLLKQMQTELNLAQGTIRYYKFEAEKRIGDYLKIWDKAKKI